MPFLLPNQQHQSTEGTNQLQINNLISKQQLIKLLTSESWYKRNSSLTLSSLLVNVSRKEKAGGLATVL